LEIAKSVISDFINTVNGVRVGVMVFNPSVTDFTSEGGPSRTNSHGGRIQSAIKSLTTGTRNQLIHDINAIVAETWTPLAETLYEAGLYYKGAPSYFNPGTTYVSPIQYACQRNYVVLITDGDSTRDQSSILRTAIGDRDNDGREPGGANEARYIVDGEDMLGTDYLTMLQNILKPRGISWDIC
jgi:type IV pilus assembly protein PilY1